MNATEARELAAEYHETVYANYFEDRIDSILNTIATNAKRGKYEIGINLFNKESPNNTRTPKFVNGISTNLKSLGFNVNTKGWEQEGQIIINWES